MPGYMQVIFFGCITRVISGYIFWTPGSSDHSAAVAAISLARLLIGVLKQPSTHSAVPETCLGVACSEAITVREEE